MSVVREEENSIILGLVTIRLGPGSRGRHKSLVRQCQFSHSVTQGPDFCNVRGGETI